MQNILNYLVITLSLLTATGVIIHDARIDRAASASLLKRVASKHAPAQVDAGITSDPHTHPHQSGKTLNGFTYQNPSFPTRAQQRIKKFMQQNQAPKGRHAFDNHNLPLIA